MATDTLKTTNYDALLAAERTLASLTDVLIKSGCQSAFLSESGRVSSSGQTSLVTSTSASDHPISCKGKTKGSGQNSLSLGKSSVSSSSSVSDVKGEVDARKYKSTYNTTHFLLL
jgi:hypothetical protein